MIKHLWGYKIGCRVYYIGCGVEGEPYRGDQTSVGYIRLGRVYYIGCLRIRKVCVWGGV